VAGEIVRGGENDVRRIDAVSGRDAGEIASGGDNEEDEIVYGLWPSPDGRRAVVSRSHRSPLVEGVSETKPFDKIGRVFDGAWSADGRSFFAAAFRRGIDGPRMPNRVSIVRFDATGAVAMTIRLDADALSLDLAPSGNIVALATEKAVELRDAATGELAETIPVRTDWWRFVSEDAALVRKGAGIGLWRRGTEGIVPLVDRPASGTLSPARDRLALVLGGRVFVYRIVR
jgi:hypothetical protein